MQILFETKFFSSAKKNRSGNSFRNKIVPLWERKQKCEAFSGRKCSLIGKKREARSVFRTKLFPYDKENRRGNRFRNKIVLLSKRKQKCESFMEQILFLWKRIQKCDAFLEPNSSAIGKKTEVRSVSGTKLFCYGNQKRSAKPFRNKIVILWEKNQKREAFFETNCSVTGKKNRSAKRFPNKIVLLRKREGKCKSFSEQK